MQSEDLKEIYEYEYQIDPDYVSDSLTELRNKLTELEGRLRKNNIQIEEIAEEPGETRGKCERKIQHLLSEELNINDVDIEWAKRVKAFSNKKKKQEIKTKDSSL